MGRLKDESASIVIDEAAGFPPPLTAGPAPIAAEPAPVAPEPPTAPRPMSPDGFELDEWGLPRVGPIRVALLDQLKRADPTIDPTGWERVPAPAATKE